MPEILNELFDLMARFFAAWQFFLGALLLFIIGFAIWCVGKVFMDYFFSDDDEDPHG